MAPIAQTKTNDIIEELSKFKTRDPVNRFALRSYKKEAEAILKNDPVNGYTTLGAIACLEHDIESMHKYHSLALNCSARSFYTITNYAVSLYKCFLWDDALSLLREAYEHDPSDLVILSGLIETCYRAGRFNLAADLLEGWNKLSPNQRHIQQTAIEAIRTALKSLPITESEICKVIRLATEALLPTDQICAELIATPIQEESHRFINIDFEFMGSAANLHEIELVVDTLLGEELDDRTLENVVVTFSNQPIDTGHNAYEMADESVESAPGTIVDFRKIAELIKDVEPL